MLKSYLEDQLIRRLNFASAHPWAQLGPSRPSPVLSLGVQNRPPITPPRICPVRGTRIALSARPAQYGSASRLLRCRVPCLRDGAGVEGHLENRAHHPGTKPCTEAKPDTTNKTRTGPCGLNSMYAEKACGPQGTTLDPACVENPLAAGPKSEPSRCQASSCIERSKLQSTA